MMRVCLTLLTLTVVLAPITSAELAWERQDGACTVKGHHFALTIDPNVGGSITKLELFDGGQWNTVFSGAEFAVPALELRDKERAYTLSSDAKAELVDINSDGEKSTCRLRARPRAEDGTPGPYSIVLSYEVYPEGAVFIDMDFQLEAERAQLTYAALSFTAPKELQKSPKYRTQNVGKEVEGFRSARVAFGKNPDKSFTNEVEVMVEYKDAMGGAVDYKEDAGHWTWVLGSDENGFEARLRYHNRVAIGLGAAVNGKPKSNVIGQRVYHWVNWLDLENWYPTNEQIDKMVANHGTMLILHHEYMLQRGSNGYPHADYAVMRDHGDMVRSIDYAHQKGLRVGLYMRGVEMYALGTEFFQKYCKRDWDGIYVDWHGPFAVSWHEMKYEPETKLGDAHFTEDGRQVPARAYFLFTKNLRDIVGPDGFLIGHQGSFNSGVFANLCFDAYLPGETGSDRHMFSERDEAAYKGMLGGGVCMPWTLDLPKYRNAEGAAKMAAWGFYPHLVLGIESRWSNEEVTFTLDPDDALYDFVEPYWNVLAHIDVEKASVFNLMSQNLTAVESSNPDFHSVVYKQEGGVYLLVTANLGAETGSAELSLATDVLDMTGRYAVRRIDAATGVARPAGTSEGLVTTSDLPQWGIEACLFKKE